MSLLGLGLCYLRLPAPSPEDVHYYFSGPLSSFTAEGTVAGNPTSGLTFSVVLTDGGAKIGSTDFELRSPDWKSPVHLHLTGARVEGGHLKATIRVENSSGVVLEGVRFDCDGALEAYDAKDADNKPIVKYRSEPVAIASPILLGDLPSKDHSDPQEIDAGELKFNPETRQVSVNFRLSGLSYLRSFSTHEGCGAGRLSLDSKGGIYMSDREGMWRTDLNGQNSTLVTKYGDFTAEVVVDPSTGEIVGGPGNGVRYVRRSVGGDDLGQIPVGEDFDHSPFYPTFSPNGDLYVGLNGAVVMYRAGKEVRRTDKVGSVNIALDGYFDVGPDGSMVVPTEGSVYWISPDWKTSKRISIGPDWHLGRLMAVDGVRRDALGNLYVTEKGWDDHPEPMRISVFDRNGHFVRVFGRGDRTPPPSDTDRLKPGQLLGIKDIAFALDGTAYISSDQIGGGQINVFRPF